MYQVGKIVDNKLFCYKLHDMVTKIHTQWVHYEHPIMGTLCHEFGNMANLCT